MKPALLHLIVFGIASPLVARAAADEVNPDNSRLHIARNSRGELEISWKSQGELAEAKGKSCKFEKIPNCRSPHVISPIEPFASYRLQSSTTQEASSLNIVGYANVALPPGLSLIANPFSYSTNKLSFWFPNPPPDSYVSKYTGNAFEDSQFDPSTGWSSPNLQIPVGTGFFFENPLPFWITNTFFGDVLLGKLTNSLPAGDSTKGALAPQSDPLSVHQLPGQLGDEVRIYTNDTQESLSIYGPNGWNPDFDLNIGQGFRISKQNAQSWVRSFSVDDSPVLQIQKKAPTSRDLTVTLYAPLGTKYEMQFRPALGIPPDWQPFTNVTMSYESKAVISQSTTNGSARFYRARRLPP